MEQWMAAVMEVMGGGFGLKKNECKDYETIKMDGVLRLPFQNPVRKSL